jgi:hypothetical protein
MDAKDGEPVMGNQSLRKWYASLAVTKICFASFDVVGARSLAT